MKKAASVEPEFLTIAEVAEYTKLSRQTVSAYIAGQGLPATQMRRGGSWRIKKTALDAWIAQHTRFGDEYLFPQGYPEGATK